MDSFKANLLASRLVRRTGAVLCPIFLFLGIMGAVDFAMVQTKLASLASVAWTEAASWAMFVLLVILAIVGRRQKTRIDAAIALRSAHATIERARRGSA